jgi:hypothetical protein
MLERNLHKFVLGTQATAFASILVVARLLRRL